MADSSGLVVIERLLQRRTGLCRDILAFVWQGFGGRFLRKSRDDGRRGLCEENELLAVLNRNEDRKRRV